MMLAELRTRWSLLPPVAVLTGVAAAAAYVAAVDPNEHGHYPTCPFLAVTGYYCPGCGSLRMIHALTHGHAGEAFGRNPLAFCLLPLLAYAWVRWAAAARRGQRVRIALPPWAVAASAGVIVAYGVVRNLPFAHALAP